MGCFMVGPMEIRAVLFDLDGTLLDSLADLACAVNAARQHLGLSPLPDDRVSEGLGEGLGHLLRHSLPARFHSDLEASRRVFLRHYGDNLLNRSRPFPGVAEVLDEITCPQALVTNKPRMFGAPILAGLSWSFDAVVFGDDSPERKPSGRPLHIALNKLRVPPEHAVFIGDHVVDLLAAQDAGVFFRAVPWAKGLDDHRLESLGSLRHIVKGEK
jgi:2-phosphoglycolate phosphatase